MTNTTNNSNNIINIQDYLDPNNSAIEIAKAMQEAEEKSRRERLIEMHKKNEERYMDISYEDLIREVLETKAQTLHRAGKAISAERYYDVVCSIRALADIVQNARIICDPKEAENTYGFFEVLTDSINKPEAGEEWLKSLLEPRKDDLTSIIATSKEAMDNEDESDLDDEALAEEKYQSRLCDEAIELWRESHSEPWSQDNTL